MKILMVCLGNICRSPLAEALLRKKLRENNLEHIQVDSAGTSGYHHGEGPDQRTVQNAKSHGVDMEGITSRPFLAVDFERFDRIYAMDQSNYENILKLANSDEQRQKVDLLLNCLEPGCNKPVPDPFFGGEAGFEKVFNLLNVATENLVREIKDGNGKNT